VKQAIERMDRQTMMYRTYAQLASDIRLWSSNLPEFVAVAGIPRAGVIVASMFAAERNIHLVTIDELIRGERPWEKSLRRNCPGKQTGTVLIVDDTVSSGNMMRKVRKEINYPDVKYGAVYGKQAGIDTIDYCHKMLGDVDHIFEWNWHHHWFVERCLFDLDGVLCEDWPHLHEEGELAGMYQNHLLNAKVLIKPSFRIGEIVTARLEKYRPQTMQWLAMHNILYSRLTMAPYNTPSERNASRGFAERKAAIYNERKDALLFVESATNQAEIIARLTGRPVLAWDRQTMYNGANP
jgi:orotate phosphoribosyltransferase